MDRPALEAVVEGRRAACPRLLATASPFPGGATAAWVILDLWEVDLVGTVSIRGGDGGANPPADVTTYDSPAELGEQGAGVPCERLEAATSSGAVENWQSWHCNNTGR